MKIIDKNKDYYDYLQGVWGQDPMAVYVRTGSFLFTGEQRPPFFATPPPEGIHAFQGEVIVTAGETEHHVYFVNGKEGIHTERFLTRRVTREKGEAPLVLEYFVDAWEIGDPKGNWRHFRHMPSKEKFIERAKALTNYPPRKGHRRFDLRLERLKGRVENPILSSFPLTLIPAEEIFGPVQDYLLSQAEPVIVDRRTDTEKLEAAGFDRKTSFRNIK